MESKLIFQKVGMKNEASLTKKTFKLISLYEQTIRQMFITYFHEENFKL